MERLEDVDLEKYWIEVEKFAARRKRLIPEVAKGVRVRFYRVGNSILCELYELAAAFGQERAGVGISHKSHRCHACGAPGDKWNQETGKVLALWRALDDATMPR